MVKAKKNPFKPYPKNQGYKGGIKVAWYYFDSKDDAEKASEAARHNAQVKEGQGFDFGYCSPGSIVKMKDGEFAGKFEVCVP